MQAMDDAATLLEIRRMNQKAETVETQTSHGPVLRRYPQSRSYLRPLERVCGTESDVEAMRASPSSTVSSNRQALLCAGLGALAATLVFSMV